MGDEMQRAARDPAPKPPSQSVPREGDGYLQRIFTFYAVGLLLFVIALVFWFATQLLLIVFASILVAITLNHTSRRLERWLPVSYTKALFLVVLAVASLLTLTGVVLGPRIVAQTDQLIQTIPSAIERLRDYFEQIPWTRELVEEIPAPNELLANAASMLTRMGTLFTGVLGALGNLLVVLVVSLYLAAQPQVYIRGFITLLPISKRQRGQEVLTELSDTLGQWMLGKLLAMTIVGVTTGIGLALLDVPLAITLGAIAGLLDFIPYLGPILAGVPALLIAFSQDPVTALYVVLLFVAVQILEGYFLLPNIDRHTVALPPALTITMQVLLGLPFGLLGVAMATPLTAVLYVLIVMLYIQDVLGDAVPTPSENSGMGNDDDQGVSEQTEEKIAGDDHPAERNVSGG